MIEFWHAGAPATEAEIEKLTAVVGFDPPARYLDLLRCGNGGEGPLALSPLWLQLWSVEEVVDFSRFTLYRRRFPGYFFFASNGASENLAMRRSRDGLLEIVTIDITMGIESAEVIATDFDAFVGAIGK